MKLSFDELKKCKKVVLSDHSLEQWNKRVGPIQQTKEEIEAYLTSLLQTPNKIEREYYDCLIFDRDIVAGTDVKEGTIVITTFLGRMSSNPLLYNLHGLLNFTYGKRKRTHTFSRQKIYVKDSINLDQSEQTLNSYTIPYVKPSHKDLVLN